MSASKYTDHTGRILEVIMPMLLREDITESDILNWCAEERRRIAEVRSPDVPVEFQEADKAFAELLENAATTLDEFWAEIERDIPRKKGRK